VALLKSFFNVQSLDLAASDFYSKDIGIKIVNAINTALNLKEVYERHLTKIVGEDGKSGQTKITGAQFFSGYFADKFYAIVTNTLNNIPDITIYTAE
jgi:hypothetical protein